MGQPLQLTEQQQAVVNHDEGPALVFAVAGAGKTTAMVHRIERLVRHRVFSPDKILATSFGRKNVMDLRQSLHRWSYATSVHTRTLHALGKQIIELAQKHGQMRQYQFQDVDNVEQHLLTQVIAVAIKQNLPYKAELETLDRQDFLSYVAACKGDLAYPDLNEANLPAHARRLAQVAPTVAEPLQWYPDLYRLFEQVRQSQGVITFSDMLLTGWEALVRYPEVQAAAQTLYQCVLVDEFQDINLVQSEMLDILTAGKRHLMAIGDDDQTIYEWRGAKPEFILNFAKRYHAKQYIINENFRCPAGALVLANQVIHHNQQRHAKRLSLTQGFRGTATLQFIADLRQLAGTILYQIQSYCQQGYKLTDMVILVRLNAQTPVIEQTLIRADIPYRISDLPFYNRLEIKTLIHYVRLAWLEERLRSGQPLSPSQLQTFREAWLTICNRPKRYISNLLRDQISEAVAYHQRLPSQAIRDAVVGVANAGIATFLENLADDLTWLSHQLHQPAHIILRQLEGKLRYEQFLRDYSGFVQTGEGRAASVSAFIEFAQEQGSLLEFVKMIKDLSDRRVGQETGQAITLSTIHQAKGLEWDIVFVPQCNQGTLPFVNDRQFNLEEERRLFYVALTRTKHHLHLYAIQEKITSQFLAEANTKETLEAVRGLQLALDIPPEQWEAKEAWWLARYVSALHLQTYFQHWWNVDPDIQTRVAHRLQQFFTTLHHQNLLHPLNLNPQDNQLWQQIAPLELNGQITFPGLEQLSVLHATTSPISIKRTGQITQINAGTWLHCNAGWGQIKAITDPQGHTLAHIRPTDHKNRLHIILRPHTTPEPVEIDLANQWIIFPYNQNIFTCAKCRQFMTIDPYQIISHHADAVHHGINPYYLAEPQNYKPLTFLHFFPTPPPNLFE